MKPESVLCIVGYMVAAVLIVNLTGAADIATGVLAMFGCARHSTR